MSARDRLASVAMDAMPVTGDEVSAAVDAYAAEVRSAALREAADALDAKDKSISWSDAYYWGYGLSWGVGKLFCMAAEGEETA